MKILAHLFTEQINVICSIKSFKRKSRSWKMRLNWWIKWDFVAYLSMFQMGIFRYPPPPARYLNDWWQRQNQTTFPNTFSWMPENVRIITLTSYWPRWRLKSPASRLFTQSFIQAQIKENIKAPRHWPLCGDRWIPHTKGQLHGKCFHLMTSSCSIKISPKFAS